MNRRIARLFAAVVLSATAGAQVASDDANRGGEGPLQNTVFLPFEPTSHERLFAGDEKLQAARDELAKGAQARKDLVTRLFDEAWDAWLESSDADPRTSVGVQAKDEGRRRLTEGHAYALARRVGALNDEERADWRERIEPKAEGALASARGESEWAAAAAAHPGTRAAALALLKAADAALEAGRDEAAAVWAMRGRDQLRLGVADDALERALAARMALARMPAPTRTAAAWQTASSLAATGAVALEDPTQPRAGLRALGPGLGVRPGLTWLDDERLAVQTAGLVHVLRVDERGVEKETRFAPGELIAESIGALETPFAARAAPGWPLLPAYDDGDLFLVAGRAYIPRGTDEIEPNALVAVAPPPRREDKPLGPRLPDLRWAVTGDRRVTGDGSVRWIDSFAPLAGLEFQPGVVFFGDTVVVQARVYGEKTRAFLLAFDRATGEPRWELFLAEGADLNPAASRFGGGTGPRLAAAPPLRLGNRVLVTTHLGAAVLVDLVDGQPVWSLAYRRRAPSGDGWSGTRPLATGQGPDETLVLFAPADSDRLYRLTPEPLRGPDVADLWRGSPAAIDGAEALVGGSPTEALVLGRSGAARSLSRRPAEGADPVDALHLGPGETFSGGALASGTRVFTSTDRGVYLFDRERDLYLLDYAALTPVSGLRTGAVVAPGCTLFARDEHVLALGIDGLWAFRAR